jgi:hypothetical protein
MKMSSLHIVVALHLVSLEQLISHLIHVLLLPTVFGDSGDLYMNVVCNLVVSICYLMVIPVHTLDLPMAPVLSPFRLELVRTEFG